MNKKLFTIGLICFSLVIVSFVKSSIEGKIKTKGFDLATNTIEELESLAIEQLSIKILPVKGIAVYVTFPDGGNMLIDTGRKTDASKLVRLLKAEATEGEKKFGMMGLIGWKPRIDWVVITGAGSDRIGGLEKIIAKFKVRKIVSYANMDLKKMVGDRDLEIGLRRLADVILTVNANHINLGTDEEVDLEQVVSPVRLVALSSGDNLNLRMTYADFSFVYISGLDAAVQSELAVKHGDALKSTLLFSTQKSLGELAKSISPEFSINPNEDITFITDGKFMSTIPYEYLVK